MSSNVYCVITEEPASKELRFRYDSERRPVSLNRPYSSAGSIPGVRSTPQNKTYPSIKVVNLRGRAKVVVCCVTVESPHKPHPHRLVGLDCRSDYGGVCVKVVDPETKTATLDHVGILCVKRRDMPTAFVERQARDIDPFKTGFDHKEQPNNINVNVVRLCFHVFLEGKTKGLFNVPICPVVSQPIYDKKSTSDFAIVDLSDCSAPVDGGKKIILLCQKVMKDDISIHFYEEVDGQIVWQGYGEFEPNDVHKQYAISFKTPAYKDLDVTEPVQVQIQLVRPSDDEFGPQRAFQLTPIKLVSSSHLPRKKARMGIIPQLGEAEAKLSKSKDTLFKLDLEREREMRAADQPMPSTSGAFRQSSYVYDTPLPAARLPVSQAVAQTARPAAIASPQACHNAYTQPPFSQPPSNQSFPQMGQPPDPMNMIQLPPQQIVNYLNFIHPQQQQQQHPNPMQLNINIQEEHSPLQHNLVDPTTSNNVQQQQHHYQQYQQQHHHHQQQEHEQKEQHQKQQQQLRHYHQQQHQHQQQHHQHHYQQQQQHHHQQQQQQHHHYQQQHQLQQPHHHHHHHQQQHQQQHQHHQQEQYHHQQQHLTDQGGADQLDSSDYNYDIVESFSQNLSLNEIEADDGNLADSLERILPESLLNYNQNNDNNGNNPSPSGQNSNYLLL